MEGLRNHNFIIPHPKKKSKREMPENQGKTPSHPLTSCTEPAGQSRKDEVACPALNINPPHSSKSFLGDIVSVDEKDFGLPESVMLGTSGALFLFGMFGKRLNRVQGALLLSAYIAYTVYLVMHHA